MVKLKASIIPGRYMVLHITKKKSLIVLVNGTTTVIWQVVLYSIVCIYYHSLSIVWANCQLYAFIVNCMDGFSVKN